MASLSRRFVHQAFDEAHNGVSKFWAFDLDVRLDERHAIGGGEELKDIARKRDCVFIRGVRQAFEKERDWHLEEVRYVLKSAGTDTVLAVFVFLDLLERDAKPVGKLHLGQVEHVAAHTHATADMLVG
jgi:hypothetical protein